MTPRQKECLDAFKALSKRGVVPSYREVADYLGITPSKVHYLIRHLEDAGYVKRQPGKRSLIVLETRALSLQHEVTALVHRFGREAVLQAMQEAAQ